MRFRMLALGLLAAAVSAGGPGAAGQDKPFAQLEEPYAFFSSDPALHANADPGAGAAAVGQLLLRPNQEHAVYVYVRNPSQRDAKVNVALGHDKATVARADGLTVAAGKTARVSLAAAATAKPAAPPPPAPAAADKAPPPPPAPPAGYKIAGKGTLTLTVELPERENANERIANKGPRSVAVDVYRPTEYLTAEAEVTADRQFIVTLKPRAGVAILSGQPVKARLDLRPDLNPDVDMEKVNAGTFEAEWLPGEGTEAKLTADNVRFKPGRENTQATVEVAVDGFDRAFLFKTNFEATKPAEYDGTFVNIRPSAEKLAPGKPVSLRLETYSKDAPVAGREGKALLALDRRGGTEFKEVARSFPGVSRKEIYVRPGADGDAVVFTTVYADWAYEFPTANTFGVRNFRLQVTGTGAAKDPEAVRTIIIDRTPPRVSGFSAPTGKLLPGQKVTLRARADDDLTGIKTVWFFLGDLPADPKPVPGKVVKMEVPAGPGGLPKGYEAAATLVLPDTKGPARIGVRAVNEVGLASVEDDKLTSFEIEVSEPPPPQEKEKDATLGKIKGKVFRGSVAQPNTAVELRSADGKSAVKSAVTDDTGTFKFKDVPPGAYAVYASQPTESGLSKSFEVEAGKETTAGTDVSVTRKPNAVDPPRPVPGPRR